MIAKTFVVVCAFFGFVSGSCIEIKSPQECSSSPVISFPVPPESSFSAPIVSDSVFLSGSSGFISSGCDAPINSAPIVADNIFSSGCSSFSPAFTSSVVSDNVYPSGSSSSIPIASGRCLSELFSAGPSAGSSFDVQATNGPESSSVSLIQAPAIEGPVVTLSSQSIPPPRVLSERCICTKTIVKPQIYQRIVTVPKIQRYLKRTVTPIIENVSYKSTPIAQELSSESASNGPTASESLAPSYPFIFSPGARSSSAPVVFSSGPSCSRLC